MSKIINLRQVRKRKQRAEEQKAADQNRRAHGQPSPEKARVRLARAVAEKRLDDHRRERAYRREQNE
jgi:hypothetical protein